MNLFTNSGLYCFFFTAINCLIATEPIHYSDLAQWSFHKVGVWRVLRHSMALSPRLHCQSGGLLSRVQAKYGKKPKLTQKSEQNGYELLT